MRTTRRIWQQALLEGVRQWRPHAANPPWGIDRFHWRCAGVALESSVADWFRVADQRL